MKHDDIWAAMSAVRAELCIAGIGKDQYNKAQGFSFRGIDDMYNSVSPILAKHGIVPSVASIRLLGDGHSVRPTKNGSVYHVAVLATVAFEIGPEPHHRLCHNVFAEAADSGDKVASKVMSMVMKYALLTALTIPTQGASDDADGDSQAPRPADAMPRPNEIAAGTPNPFAAPLDKRPAETAKARPEPEKKPWPSGLTATEAPDPEAPGFARIILASLQEAQTLDDVLAVADHIPENLTRSMKPAVKEARERVDRPGAK